MKENSAKKTRRLHVVGICGVATSAIAIAFHKKGWKVTGSDKGFYPPVSTHLTESGISYYAGWHPERMIEGGLPDVVMIGAGGTSPSNPEALCAHENKIPVYTYPEILQKYFIKKNSLVVAGTWGKTTISSLLSFILIKTGLNPSYFTGGLSLSHDTGAMSDSDWSVVEGDEYQISISDKRPKFVYYSPTHLVLTSVSWDHADLYPTEKSYFEAFEKLLVEVPGTGKIVACVDDVGVRKVLNEKKTGSEIKAKIITYGKDPEANYNFHSVNHTKAGINFSIKHKTQNGVETFTIESPMLGRFNAENITAAFAMACEIGITPEKIVTAIKEFKGIKRRLQRRLDEKENKKGVTVLDCHAPTAEKAASVLESVREVYDKNIIAIYEPNIGGRQRESISMYDNAFKDADFVFIPRLTKLKVDLKNTDAGEKNQSKLPLEGDELAGYISKTHKSVEYVEDDKSLVDTAIRLAKKGDVIVFLGSHGFRGMIEETVEKLSG